MKRLLTLLYVLSFLARGLSVSAQEEGIYELDEVVVTATKTERILTDVPVRTEVITSKEIKASGAKTLLEVLDKNLLGVRTVVRCAGCNFSELRMQGLGTEYNQILIDGMPLLGAVMNVYGLEQILVEDIERIEIIKGSSSSLYGSNVIGGVINIITREPRREKVDFNLESNYGDYETYNISLSMSGRKDNIAGVFTAQKSESDAVDENEDGWSDKVSHNNRNSSLKTHFYFLDDDYRLTLFGREFYEKRNFGPMTALPCEIDTQHYEYGAGCRAILGEDRVFNLNFAASNHERNLETPALDNDANEDIWTIDVNYSHPLLEGKHAATYGITYKDEKLNEVINHVDSPEKDSRSAGVYLQDEIELFENLDLVAGIRYDNVDSCYIDDSCVCMRFGAKWDAAEQFSIRASIGQGFKVPYLFSQQLHVHPTAPAIYRDTDLESEKSLSYSLSGEYLHDIYTLGINLFRTDMEKKIILTTAGAPSGYDWILKNGPDAYTQGIETNLRIQIIEPLSLNLGLAFTDAQFKEKQTVFNDESEHLMRVPELTGLLGAEWSYQEHGVKVNFGGRFTGNQYIENKVEGKIDRTPSCSVWDLRVGKKFKDGGFSIFGGIDNIFDYTQEKRYTVAEDAAYAYAPLTGRYIYGGVKIGF